MAFLTRETLLAKTARRYVEVTLPDGESARLQSLSELERSEHNSGLLKDDGSVDKEKLKAATCQLVCMMLVDESGARVLHDHEWESLQDVDSAVMEVLGDAARKHIGWDKGNEKKSETTVAQE